MNEYDSQVASGLLKSKGYEIVGGQGEADIFIMNTCSVREHAEDKVYSRLGKLGKIKRSRPDLMIGLMGCMVEEHREKLFKRFPQLDFMVGTRNINELSSIIEEVTRTRKQVAKIKHDGISIEYTDLIERRQSFYAWLPIMTGCNKVCTYCIVPLTRGSEVSMPEREVYREAARLAGEGVKWITLLGQNVNSYMGASENVSFPELLEMLCGIDGLERISFTTSHPSDATEGLFRVIARNPKISRRFHLPLQSGSDRMLKRMKRLHTYQEFKDKIDLMRRLIPDISVTTDLIAGFSGETEEDHQATLRALEEIRFDAAFIYKYSVRAQTPAARLKDEVATDVKERRHHELLSLQKKIGNENSRNSLGKIVNCFVEAESSKRPGQLIGRTDHDRKVVFPEGGAGLIGTFVQVELTGVEHETFSGRLCKN